MEKKSIEKVFREKLQDYSHLPEETVWENISASLDKKQKKRRILPIWWKMGGVAALFVIGLIIFLPQNDLPTSEEVITDSELNVPSKDANSEKNLLTDPVLSDSDTADDPENATVVSNSKNEIEVLEKKTESNYQDLNGGSELAGREDKTNEASKPVKNESALAAIASAETDKASENTTSEIIAANVKGDQSDALKADKKAGVQKGKLLNENKELIVNSAPKKEEIKEVMQEDPEEENKTSIFEAIAQQEEENLKEESTKKWELGPRVAPVFFSSLAQGSPIHSTFENNAKSGNVNMSYGLAVSYKVAKRVKIRSGIHKVDFGYDTRDVNFSSSLNANTNGIIDNIDYSLSSRNLVVRSNTRSGKIATENAQDVAGPDPSLNGKMVQDFGYLEVPLELTYEILDRKFGVNVVGGLSSLFLVNNSVTLESNGITTEMGEANNLNDLNLSTNFGIGVSYQFNDKLQLSLEPMFKYQLNTFSETSGNFQPFSMGVYSGLNFRF
ncbi:MAG: outer membrane beta-barrel protein [Flavobacteriaceae bacterium]|nr:outer membrane beta-barrel protein [Flavobacteriaceae bacterium]